MKKTQATAWAFLCPVLVFISFLILEHRAVATPPPSSSTVAEDLNADEKRQMIEQLLAEGDRQMAEKNYNIANANYESVFLLDPNHLAASQRIDHLKKQMLQEGRSETELVARVYDSEIEERVRQYLVEAKQLLADQRWSRARFTLQKLLLLNPLHEEASQLYRDVNRKLYEGAS